VGDNCSMSIQFQTPTRFAALGEAFFTPLLPTPLPSPYAVGVSAGMAAELGLDANFLTQADHLSRLTGNHVSANGAKERLILTPASEPAQPAPQPLASVYSGHQFGVWAGQLGDGRAILLGDVLAAAGAHAGQALELQLKGAGRTPYSRMGDGRAVLRSSIREFLCSEAMHALGVPTTRALCVTGSDALVRREESETAAVVARLAPSFIRFGHFEHFAATGDVSALKVLADHVIAGHFPHCADAPNAYVALLGEVAKRTARLIAHWQALGFCHGVMNTDNMSILGLTIDYGPFGFLDGFDPAHVCNHSDTQGRYAFARQPNVGNWNLFCLGQALLPLIEASGGTQDDTLAALALYQATFPQAMAERLNAKMGLREVQPGDTEQANALMKLLAAERVDWTIFWRTFSTFAPMRSPFEGGGGVLSTVPSHEALRDLFIDRAAFDAWAQGFAIHLNATHRQTSARIARAANPAIVLRNHLAQAAIDAAKLKDFSVLARLHEALQNPYQDDPSVADLAAHPPSWAQHLEVSCSS
jgi:serine/tyrosine/threonine adenylyltransferase